jgi:hypothetical protein
MLGMEESTVFLVQREVVSVWSMRKDGKRYWAGASARADGVGSVAAIWSLGHQPLHRATYCLISVPLFMQPASLTS